MSINHNQTVWELLSAQARARGTAIAVEAPDRSPLSWAALIDQIERTRGALRGFGIGPTDRIAAVLPNGPEAAVAFLSVGCSAVAVPLNPAYTEAEIAFHLQHLKVRAVLVPAGTNGHAVDVARSHGCSVITLRSRNSAAGTFDLWCDTNAAPAGEWRPPSTQTPALILQTSGTTSQPKIVPLTHANICASATHVAESLALNHEDRCLVVMPQFHVHGLVRSVLGPLSAGGAVICAPGFQALHFLDWLEHYKPTWYTAVPTIHQAIVDQAQRRGLHAVRSTLRLIRSGSAPLHNDLMQALERTFGVPVIQGYGMTEAASQVASNPLPPHVRKPGSIGLPAGPEMAVIDEQGRLLGAEQPGEIIVRGPNVMSGYEDNQQATDAAFLNGWFRTGDQGYRDSDGYYFLTGRLRDMINRGGQKITPQEVDDVLLAHPCVAHAVTFAVPDARLGDAVAAAVVLRPNEVVTERQLAEFAACRLAFFKIPERIFFLQELPKGPTGKVKRSLLADALGLSGGLRSPRTAEEHAEEAGPEPEEFVLSQVIKTAAEVLGVSGVDRDRSFLESGGDSVRAMLFVARLSDAFGVTLTFLDVFYAPSFLSVARIITARVLDQVESTDIEDHTDRELT